MLIRCGIKLRLLGGRRFSNIGPFIYPGTLPSPERLKPWQNEAIRACVNAINTGRTKIGMHIHGDSFLSLLPDLLDRIKPSPHVQQRKPEVLVVAANINRATKIATTIAQSRREWLVEVDTAQDKTASEATVLVTTYAFAVEDCYRHHRLLKRIDVSALKTIVLTDVEIFEDEPWVVEPRVHPPRLQQVYFDDFSSRFLAKPRWLALFQKYSPVVIATTTEGAVDLNTIRRLGPIEVVYRRTLLDSLVGKWECNPRFLAVPVRLDLQGISARKKLSKAMRSPEILHATVEAWLSNAAGIRKTTLVYCVDDAHASELEKLFRASNIDARQHKQTNGQPDKKYDEIMDEWSAGNFPVLIVSHSETVWVSRIDCLVLATAPTKNSEVYENRLLSAMRASPDTGKEDSLVIELLDTSESPQTDSYDIRALLQLDAAEISGQPLDVLQARAAQLAEFALPMQLEKREQARLSRTPTQGVPISIMRYPAAAYRVRIQEEERDKAFGIINDFSPLFNWVYCRSGVYVHDCFGAGHALISRKEGTPFFLSDS
ncbi:hypothetical protein C8F04DRAFT_1066827 [Mycena alexandri]|uniref:Helicase C-terminal domain-containing protein n=1 Tax=Mycena alexandri TaxID=1745969 RepID=A0AAD6XFC3_9AGAR|nr:hypothetical protein C8F04DRAFT_1066827 [Mycena alexandri]